MSIERLLELNPDIILGMTTNPNPSPAELEAFRGRFDKLSTLSAAKNQRIGVVAGPEIYSTGPLLLQLVERFAEAIRKLEPKDAP